METRALSHYRFYGRRKGRKLTQRQLSLLAESTAILGLGSLTFPAAGLDIRNLFTVPVSSVWFEIGFGAGEHLLWQAGAHPNVGIVGADPFINGAASLLSAITGSDLESRVRVYPADASVVLDVLPPASVERGFMLFPDPWPKTRHKSRRLLSDELLDKISTALEDGAEFRFASDIADYSQAAVAMFENHPAFELTARFTGDRRDTVPDWPPTRYEGKAIRDRRACTFLIFKRRSR